MPDPIFACTRDVATTRFVYPAGSYDISLQPLCGDVNNPTVAKNYEVPAPIEREVRTGQLVELNALLVVIRDPSSLACPL